VATNLIITVKEQAKKEEEVDVMDHIKLLTTLGVLSRL
jgi:hypothetical protein